MKITPERLAAIKARVAAATPGPWEWAQEIVRELLNKRKTKIGLLLYWLRGPARPDGSADPSANTNPIQPADWADVCHLYWSDVKRKEVYDATPSPADSDFIAHSRTDIPDLIEALEAAEARIRELEQK